jgi:hypothetical protein
MVVFAQVPELLPGVFVPAPALHPWPVPEQTFLEYQNFLPAL